MQHLAVSLLGQFAVTRDGQGVTGFSSVKVRGLLVYLLLEADRAHSREALATLLWPEVPSEAARTYLRQALANLRTVLGEASPLYLLIDRDGVQFNAASSVELDVAEFRALLAACAQIGRAHV